MSVLANTNVGFNWTFTFVGPVYVTWDYLEPRDGTKSEPVMTLDQNNLTIRPNWSSRIEYVNFTGSAVMNMSNTTKADSGQYKVLVADVNGIFPAIRHSVTLTVVPEVILVFNIKVANMTFDLSVAENGTNVTLPDGTVTLPTIFDVYVKIDAMAPRPSVIRIQNRLGSSTTNTSCAHNRSCVMRLNFNETKNAFHQTDIFSKIDFGIQNLPPIYIKGTAALKTTAPGPSSRLAVGITAGIVLGVIVVIVALIGVFCWRKRKKTPNRALRPEEIGLLHRSQRHMSAMPVVRSIDEPNKVSGLDSFVTESEHLTCAEYCFRVPLNVAEESDVDAHVTNIKQIVTALLNTSGGIIELGHEGTRTGYWKTFDEYKIAITRVLLAFLPERVYNKCVKFSGNEFPLQLLVKKSDSVISVTSHLFIRKSGDSSTVKDASSIRDVMTQDSALTHQDPFPEGKSLQYGRSYGSSIKQGAEYTCLPEIETESLRSDIAVTQFLNDSAKQSLLVFPNNSSGGYVIIGMDEPEYIVRGQNLSEQYEYDVSQLVGTFLQKDNNDNRRIWGDEARTPQEGREWSIRFIPVAGGPPTERRRLIVIRVNHCQGGFWAKCPESFMISEEGSVLNMTFSSWKEAVTRTSAVTASFAKSETAENTAEQHILKTPQDGPSQSQQRDPITPRVSTDDSNVHNATAGTVSNNMEYISFQEHSSQKNNIKDASTDLLLNACKFLEESDVFKFGKSMREVMGSKELRNVGRSKAISTAIRHIKSAQDRIGQSFFLITPSWTRDTSAHTAVDRPPGHIRDVFVVDEHGNIKF